MVDIKTANTSEALECLEDIYRNGVFISEVSFEKQHPTNISPETNKSIDVQCNTIKQALLNAEKDEKIILGIEDYLNRRIKSEPLEDVRKAFIEIRTQLQVIKEVLE